MRVVALSLAFVLSGCSQTLDPSVAEKIVVRFIGASHDAYTFTISNNGAQRVTFQGLKGEGENIVPLIAASCFEGDGGSLFYRPIGHDFQDEETFKLKPAETLKLVVYRSWLDEAVARKCRISIWLSGDVSVWSDAFVSVVAG